MKAKDITPGGFYFAEVGYRENGKVKLEAAPVVRMRQEWSREAGEHVDTTKPERRDGRADGARVLVCETGKVKVIRLTQVVRPWTEEDDQREAAVAERDRERAEFKVWAEGYGLAVRPERAPWGEEDGGEHVSLPRAQLARLLRVLETNDELARTMRDAVLYSRDTSLDLRGQPRELLGPVLDAMLDDREAAR